MDYRLSRNVEEPAAVPDIFAIGPNGFQAPLKVSKVAAGHYRGRLMIGGNQGLFRVRPARRFAGLSGSRLLPAGRRDAGVRNNEALLRQIATSTGGRFNPDLRAAFDAGGHSIRTTMNLWPGLLALAILLNLVELVLRKGVLEALHLRRQPARDILGA